MDDMFEEDVVDMKDLHIPRKWQVSNKRKRKIKGYLWAQVYLENGC